MEKLRLNPTQLNNLNLSYSVGLVADSLDATKRYHIDEGSIETKTKTKTKRKGSVEITRITEYQKFSSSEDGSNILVLQAVDDKQGNNKIKNLDFINNVIISFLSNSQQKAKLLIPLMQSRFGKRHAVLVEVDIDPSLSKREIHLHDSQSRWRSFFYPNRLNDLKSHGFQVSYKSYARQKDNYSCAWFVYHYIKHILTGNSTPLRTINVKVTKEAVLQELNDNFVKLKANARKMTASGEPLSWKKESLKKELEVNYLANLETELIFEGKQVGVPEGWNEVNSHTVSKLSTSSFFTESVVDDKPNSGGDRGFSLS